MTKRRSPLPKPKKTNDEIQREEIERKIDKHVKEALAAFQKGLQNVEEPSVPTET